MSNRDRYYLLIKSFNSLAHTVKGDREDWNCLALFSHVRQIADDSYASSGQRAAAQFCMHIYNYNSYYFDLGKAIRVWDSSHLKAWQKWAQDPWFL